VVFCFQGWTLRRTYRWLAWGKARVLTIGSILAWVAEAGADNERNGTKGGETKCSTWSVMKWSGSTCRRHWP
jgi:hypothetical protein